MTKKLLVIFAALLIGLAAVGGIADEVQTLRGTSPADLDQAPPLFTTKDGPRIERNYRQQPPLIPHRIEKYQIDLRTNMCLHCHDWPNNTKENAPMVSISHFMDRNGNKLDKVSSQRWFCVQCHVPQADALPLVENTFKPADK